MPSRASTSFLPLEDFVKMTAEVVMCQCPLGLVPHFYRTLQPILNVTLDVSMPSRASTSFLLSEHFSEALRICAVSMPSRASTSFLPSGTIGRYPDSVYVSMPSRASTSFLQYPFKNLGFMRFPEPVFAGICQNILTVTVFRAC